MSKSNYYSSEDDDYDDDYDEDFGDYSDINDEDDESEEEYDALPKSKQPGYKTPARRIQSKLDEKMIKKGSKFGSGKKLTTQQKKYCECVAKVGAKGGTQNKYAICAKSTGTSLSRRGCGDFYNWKEMETEEIVAFLEDKGIKVKNPESRRSVMTTLNRYKKEEGL